MALAKRGRLSAFVLVSFIAVLTSAHAELKEDRFASIQDIVEREIQAGNIPGAVVLIGTPDNVIYRRAFGYRSLEPEKLPMTEGAIFDVASLTKVVATTTAVMQLMKIR